jgi:hypothetical protein
MGISCKSEVLLKYPGTKIPLLVYLKEKKVRVHIALDIGHFKGHNTLIVVYVENFKDIKRCHKKKFWYLKVCFEISYKLEFTSIKVNRLGRI